MSERKRYYEQSNDRTMPADYDGDILVWDIDKTYLDTRFSSWRGLAAIPFEFAIDKRTIPGSVPLLRALRHGPDSETALTPLYFVSGSPPQLRRVVERRMMLDAVQFDGISFKDQFGLLMARRFRDVKAQVGYKLGALLDYRKVLPDKARWLCFGDDVESDASVFALFGQVCGGLRGEDLRSDLRRLRVHQTDIQNIVDTCDGLPTGTDPVERIFIHLAHGTDPSTFTDDRVVASRSYLQSALVLLHMKRIRPQGVTAVAKELRVRGRAETDIQRDLEDAAWRLGVPLEYSVLAGRR